MSNIFEQIATRYRNEAAACRQCKNKCTVDPMSQPRLVAKAPAAYHKEDRFRGCIAIVGVQRKTNVPADGPGFVHYHNDPALAGGLIKTPFEIALREGIVAARAATGLRLPVYSIPVIRCHVPVSEDGRAHNRGWDTIAAYNCSKMFAMERHDVYPRVAITFGISIDPWAGAEVYMRPGVQTYNLPAVEPGNGPSDYKPDPRHLTGRIRRNGGHLRFEVGPSWAVVGPWVKDTICQAIVDASILPERLDKDIRDDSHVPTSFGSFGDSK